MSTNAPPHSATHQQNQLGLYLHWPYCARICPYCDFNVYRHKTPDIQQWQNALMADLHYWHDQSGGRVLESLYFGGGTPSLMPPQLISKIIDTCQALWGFAPNAEITLEANPTDAQTALFKDFSLAGVNRLSLGVQSLRDDALKFLGRDHSAQEGQHAIALAAQIFPHLTIDLIYARPDQDLTDWQQELREVLAGGINHLSVYQLTIEPGTAFAKAVARKDWRPPNEESQESFHDLTQAICTSYGLNAYEVSNHAKSGAQSRHNHLYWQYQDYIGIGPGAHGRLSIKGQRHAISGTPQPKKYLIQSPQKRYTLEKINPIDQGTEYLAMSLRLTTGSSLARYQQLTGIALPSKKLAELQDSGHLTCIADQLALTAQGRKVLNRIVLELLG